MFNIPKYKDKYIMIGRIIESYEEFLNENAAGAATYGVVTDPSSIGSIGSEYMELLIPFVKNATSIMNKRTWDNIIKCVGIYREDITGKFKSDSHSIPVDNENLAKKFIKIYGQDYVASFLIKLINNK